MSFTRFFKPQVADDVTATSSHAVKVELSELIQLADSSKLLGPHHGRKRAALAGNYLTRIKGRGMEFDEVRAYVPGDDVRSLDWRVTARTGKPHTKLFQEERERPVFVSVDYSRSMFFATRGRFKSVIAAQLAALVAWRAFHHGDRIGGQVFNESDLYEVRPKQSKATILHLLKILAEYGNLREAQSKAMPLASQNNLESALAKLCRHARPGSLVYLISDFRQLGETGLDNLLRLNRHCDLVLFFVYDILERELPIAGRYRIQGDQGDLQINTDDSKQRLLYTQRFIDRQQKIEQFAQQQKITLVSCSTTDSPLNVFQSTEFPHA